MGMGVYSKVGGWGEWMGFWELDEKGKRDAPSWGVDSETYVFSEYAFSEHAFFE